MKNLACLTLAVLCAILLGACAGTTPQTVGGPINPGDKIGDFTVAKGASEGVDLWWRLSCDEESAEKETCQSTLGTKVNVSWGFYADTNAGKDLDTVWSSHTLNMEIGGRPVNLQAFGSIEYAHPMMGKMRYWNVVIVTDKPGEITVHSAGGVEGESSETNLTLVFSRP